MALFDVEINDSILGLLATRVVNKIVTGLKRGVAGGGSVTKSAYANYFSIPIFVSDDIPRNVVDDTAKFIEVKIAYDIKRILERDLVGSAKDMTFDKIMDIIPFTRVNRNVVNVGLLTDLNTAYPNIKIDYNSDTGDFSQVSESSFDKSVLDSECMDIIGGLLKTTVNVYSEANSLIVKERGAVSTNIEVEVKYTSGSESRGYEIKTAKYQFAIEAVPRYVDSNEFRLRMSMYDARGFAKKYVKWLDRENHFWRDLILDLDAVKQHAKDRVTGGIFSEIEKMQKLSASMVMVRPFTCLLISQDFKDKLYKEDRMDLNKTADAVMKSFFAMGLLIYDNDTDIMELKFDGDKYFTKYTFDNIAGETSKYEKQLQQLVRLGGR